MDPEGDGMITSQRGGGGLGSEAFACGMGYVEPPETPNPKTPKTLNTKPLNPKPQNP